MQQFSAFFVANWPLFLALAIILFMLVRSYVGPGAARAMSPMEALQLINHQNALVLDVRTDKEYQDGHIINAMPAPLGMLSNHLTKLAPYKQTPIVVVCRSGARSAQAVATLRKAGFEQVYNLAGGIMAWQNASMPLTTEKGKPPKPGAAKKVAQEEEAVTEGEAAIEEQAGGEEKTGARAIGEDAPVDKQAPAADAPVEEEGKKDAPEIVIYTTAHCPFCVRAVQLLKDKGVAYIEVSVDGKPELRQEMTRKAGSSSVPQVFVDGEHIGDCDGIHALDAQGKLDSLLGLTRA